MYSMPAYCTAQCTHWFQSRKKWYFTISGSQVMIVCLLASSHNPSSTPLKAISTLLQQSEYQNKATVASLAHSLAFSTGWQNNQGHSLTGPDCSRHEFLSFTPETFDQKCAQWLLTASVGLWCYGLCQHCHKIASLKNDDVSKTRWYTHLLDFACDLWCGASCDL